MSSIQTKPSGECLFVLLEPFPTVPFPFRCVSVCVCVNRFPSTLRPPTRAGRTRKDPTSLVRRGRRSRRARRASTALWSSGKDRSRLTESWRWWKPRSSLEPAPVSGFAPNACFPKTTLLGVFLSCSRLFFFCVVHKYTAESLNVAPLALPRNGSGVDDHELQVEHATLILLPPSRLHSLRSTPLPLILSRETPTKRQRTPSKWPPPPSR